ncbi:MAG: hypothetical protein LBG09_02170 [Puniceicoccales bacterium]|jgi:hypothetical protein|nr:hypothetical protein [Puniceicoccales bacterium]
MEIEKILKELKIAMDKAVAHTQGEFSLFYADKFSGLGGGGIVGAVRDPSIGTFIGKF